MGVIKSWTGSIIAEMSGFESVERGRGVSIWRCKGLSYQVDDSGQLKFFGEPACLDLGRNNWIAVVGSIVEDDSFDHDSRGLIGTLWSTGAEMDRVDGAGCNPSITAGYVDIDLAGGLSIEHCAQRL